MVRNPSDKPKVKHRKGLWSPEEDERLRSYIIRHGHGCWSSVPTAAGLQRNGKSCRLRWINYLRPGLKRGLFTSEEEETILTLHRAFGNKWSQIANHLSGRTDNEIKNYWHSYLKKKIEAQSKVKSNNKQESPCSVARVSSFESLVSKEGSSLSSSSSLQILDQNLPRRNHQSSPLPRILFEEWLTIDNINSPNHDHSFYSNTNETFNYSQSNTSNDGNSSAFSNLTYDATVDYSLCDAYTNLGDDMVGFDTSSHGGISTVNDHIQDNVGIVDFLHGNEYSMQMFGNLI